MKASFVQGVSLGIAIPKWVESSKGIPLARRIVFPQPPRQKPKTYTITLRSGKKKQVTQLSYGQKVYGWAVKYGMREAYRNDGVPEDLEWLLYELICEKAQMDRSEPSEHIPRRYAYLRDSDALQAAEAATERVREEYDPHYKAEVKARAAEFGRRARRRRRTIDPERLLEADLVGLSKAQLAKRLGVSTATIARMRSDLAKGSSEEVLSFDLGTGEVLEPVSDGLNGV